MVSYQYLDSLSEPGTQTTITSPVVSYQYFDWPGDENLAFTNSPHVSYYFSGGVVLGYTGFVQTLGGAPVAGAAVTLKRFGTVFWTGITDANGTFSAPGLPAANYTITVAKAGYQTVMNNIAGYHGGSGTLAIKLALAPPPLARQLVARVPLPLAIKGADAPDASDDEAPVLKVFNGTDFVKWHPATPPTNATIYPNRPTIVMSHGMQSDTGAWALPLARLIYNQLSAVTVPNIVAWDWKRPANRLINGNTAGPPIDAACDQGLFLGDTLQRVLGASYSQPLHFIGHSLGTIVNQKACDYVHGKLPESPDRLSPNVANPWSLAATRPHVTLLDEAEVASVFGTNVVTATQLGAAVAALVNPALAGAGAVTAGVPAVLENWKSPIPFGATWVDSYISMVGIQRPQAVNVCLLKPAFTFTNPITAHGYAHEWYRWSVDLGPFSPTPAPPAIGYRRSREYADVFPPTGTGTTPGSLWYEHLGTADALDLLHQPNPLDFEGNALILGAYAVQAGPRVVSKLSGATRAVVQQFGEAALDGLLYVGNDILYPPLDATGRFVMESYVTGIETLGEVNGSILYHTGNVTSEIGEKVGNLWDATTNAARNAFHPDYAAPNLLLVPGYLFRLRTGSVDALVAGRKGAAPANATNQPAYLWLNVTVPPNAGFMAFDFTVSGDPREDRIVCAVNEVNVFSLAGKFAPAGVPSSTELIDVSAYAGQSVELMFGLTGGTSTNCEAAIDGVRFITVPQPKIGIVDAAPNLLLKWPAAATGWALEATDSLAPANWQPVPMDAGVAVDSGVVTFQQPKAGGQKFYRLRRSP